MTPKRWRQVEQMYHSALTRAPEERAAFLREQCEGDDELRTEVETLLQQDPPPSSTLSGAGTTPPPTITEPVSPQAEANAQRRRRGRPSPEPILQRLGKYELQTEIGRGGFGSVYIAWDPVVERKVAIKVLTAGSDQDTLIRFRNEASSAGKLRHKNIVTIYDFGEDAGVPFIVMELLDGRDLHDILAQKTPLTLDQEAHILSQAASGLHHAHVNGLVHRDVKPSNVMVLRDFSVKILDFGIARLMQATNSRLTQEGSIVGTMSYMSPEQLRGADCDALSDIFSLGVVAYELVTRRHPFHARDPAAVMYAITSKEPEPVRALVPECPAAIEEVIMRALAKDRDLRYHSAEDMVLDIEPILRELRQQRAAKLLSEAQTTLEAGQLETASGLAREIIDLDPGSSAARRFRDTIQQKLQRRAVKPKIEALLSESQDMLTLRHFHSALERVEHALRLDRTDQRAQALRDKVRAAREHAKRAEALLAEAHKAFEEKNLTGAYQNVSAALQSDRDNPDAAVFLEKIRQEIDQRERERALREGLAKARASMTIESFDEALTLLAVLRAQQPDSSDVQDLEVEVRRRKTDSERRDRLLRGLSSARDLLRQQQISEAIRLLEPLVSEFPNTAEAADLLSFAHQAEQAERRARKVAEIEQSVEQCLTAQDFVEAGNLIQKAAAEFPADASIARLQQRVQSVKAAADRERAIREIFAKGEEFLGAQKFSEGIRLLDDALQEHGNEATLVELRGRVELQWAVVKREQARKAVVAEARRLLDNEQAAAAISSIQQALTVHPADAELGAMLGLAQRMLADQQRAEAVARLTQEIGALITAGQLDLALSSVEDGLQRFSEEPALLALKSRIGEAQKVVEHRRAVQKVQESTEQLLKARRFAEALEQVEKALERDRDDDLIRLKKDVETQWEQEKLREALAKAREHLEKSAIGEAIAILEAAAEQHNDSPEIAALLSYARERKRAAEKRAAVDKILIESAGLADAGRLSEALQSVEEGCRVHPNESALMRLRDTLLERVRVAAELKKQEEERQRQLAEQRRLEAERKRQEEERQRQLAEQRRIEAERKQQEEERQRQLAEQRRIEAEERKRQEEEARRRRQQEEKDLEEVLRRTVELRQNRATGDALQVVDDAIGRLGHKPQLAETRKLIVADLKRAEDVQKALQEAQQAFDRDKLKQALEILSRIEAKYPNDPDVRPLREAVSHKIEDQRVQASLSEIVRGAEALRSKGKLQQARDAVLAGVRKYPNTTALQEVVDRIERELQILAARERVLAEFSRLLEQVGRASDEPELEAIGLRSSRLASEHSSDSEIEKAAAAVSRAASVRRAELEKLRAEAEASQAAAAAPAPVPPPQIVPEPAAPSVERAHRAGLSSRSRLGIAATLAILAAGAGVMIWRGTGTRSVAVHVSTTPAGASVSIGPANCTTPNCEVNLAAGRYEVRAQLPGYRPATANLDVKPSSMQPLQLTLVPLPARLVVGTNFARGDVTLDGGAVGALRGGEFSLDSIAPGSHILNVRSPDGQATLRFQVTNGKPPSVLAGPEVSEAQAIVVTGWAASPEIRCDCSTGEVTVDGRNAGRLSNGRLALGPLPAGTHQFRVTAPDGARDSIAVLQNDPSLNLFLTADRNMGTLVVETGSDDVRVYVNNRLQPMATRQGLLRLPVAIGRYSVRVDKAGFRAPPAQTVEVKKGALERLSFQLAPSDATLAIHDAPSGIRVQIDGRTVGVTAADGSLQVPVAPGNHTVDLARDGYSPRKLTLAFGPGAVISPTRGELELAEIRAPAPPPPPPPAQVKATPPDTRALESEDWERVRNSRDINQLEEFRRKYPSGANSEQAGRRIEQLEWENLRDSNDVAALNSFLRKYPNSTYGTQARRRIEDIDWTRVNKQDAASIRAFLQRDPDSSQAAQANAALASLQQADRLAADRRAVLQALDRYQRAYDGKNIRDLTAVWPSLSGSNLETIRQVFRTARSISLQLNPTREPEVAGDSATVQCKRILQQTFERQPLVNEDTVTITLRRSGESWLIRDVR